MAKARFSPRKFFGRPAFLVGAMLLIMAAIAGAFFLTAAEARPLVLEYFQKPKEPTRNFTRAEVSFAGLLNRPLSYTDLKTFTQEIADPHTIAIIDDILYVASWSEDKLYRINLENGEQKLLADELDDVRGLAKDADGQLVATVFNEGRVVRINPQSGRVSKLAEDLNGPWGIVSSRDGEFYVTNATSGSVLKLKNDGTSRTVTENLKEPAGLLADNDNILTVAQRGDSENSLVTVADNGTVTSGGKGYTQVEGLLRDDERNLLLTYSAGGNGALAARPRGQEVKALLATTLPGSLLGPVTDGKYLYIAAPERNAIYRVTL